SIRKIEPPHQKATEPNRQIETPYRSDAESYTVAAEPARDEIESWPESESESAPINLDDESENEIMRPAASATSRTAAPPQRDPTPEEVQRAKQAWLAWQAQQQGQTAQPADSFRPVQTGTDSVQANDSMFAPSRLGLTVFVACGVLAAAAAIGYVIYREFSAPQSETVTSNEDQKSDGLKPDGEAPAEVEASPTTE
ncbi:MAG: hypothetical protein JWM11_2687, partial [Planctomycetaceae bacterium]|nr:hypothetical protein [Planctomycetaceae bacterium]